MTDSIPTETLINCTRLLLNQKRWKNYINISEVDNANRSDIFEILSRLIDADQVRDETTEWSVR